MFKSIALLQNIVPTFKHTLKCSTPILFIKSKMTSANSNVPLVDIDPSGVFKYILINVYDKDMNESEPQMVIVRGYKRCEYHADIFDEVQAKLSPLDCEPLGGGRISHDPDNKKIHIYGYSQGYGKADHEVTAKLVKGAYPAYTISVSDEDGIESGAV